MTTTTGMVAVDVGGTFTDVVAIHGGEVQVTKVPTDVHHSETSVLTGAERVGVERASVFNLASTAGPQRGHHPPPPEGRLPHDRRPPRRPRRRHAGPAFGRSHQPPLAAERSPTARLRWSRGTCDGA